MLQTELGEEHVAHAGQDQVPTDRLKLTNLKVIHPQLHLAVLEGPLDRPPAEGRPKQVFRGGRLRAVTDEVLDHRGVQGILDQQQMIRSGRQTLLVSQVDQQRLDLPDHRTLAAFLDLVALPADPSSLPRVHQDLTHLDPGVVLDLQARQPGRPTQAAITAELLVQNRRTLRPDSKVLWDLRHIVVPHTVQRPEKRRLSSVSFIKRQPGQTDPVGRRSLDLVQGDLPLGSIGHLIGNAGLSTTDAILIPGLLRQVEVSVEQGMEPVRGIAQMDADHAVLRLAYGPAVLSLDAGGLEALFDEAGLVNHSHGLGMGIVPGDILLKLVSQGRLIPSEQAQELLQVPSGLSHGVGHGFETLSGQVTELPLDVQIQVASSRDPAKAVIKLGQEACQFWFDPHDRIRVHADDLQSKALLPLVHRLAA